MFGWELSEEEMTELDGLDENEQREPLEGGKKGGGGEKRGGSVSWGGAVVAWREGDGL